ncbi:MAG TPA: hypothetical protein VHB79_08895 [Polyangiaceae bacterium]|nr:hypothetical protein [Polyangiaceae bacterium]
MSTRPIAGSLAACLLSLSALGCAVNVSEARSARVLRGGEIQVSEVNNVVVPTRAVSHFVSNVQPSIDAAKNGSVTDEERDKLVGAATAIALTGPGFGVHTDIGVGLGYRYDLQARLGNGIYALSLRRGFDLGTWQAAIGTRAAYNSGAAFLEYLDDVAEIIEVSDMKRFDGQLFAQVGKEWGEWGKLWFGAKGIWSPLKVQVDARKVNGGVDTVHTTLWQGGGFVGGALGYRWIHFVAELTVLGASGKATVFGRDYDLSGVVVAPSWGLMGTF